MPLQGMEEQLHIQQPAKGSQKVPIASATHPLTYVNRIRPPGPAGKRRWAGHRQNRAEGPEGVNERRTAGRMKVRFPIILGPSA